MGNDPTLEDVLGGLVEVAEGDDWEPPEAVAERVQGTRVSG
jgi:hypothetical protein